MDDTQMLNWLHQNMISYRCTFMINDVGEDIHELIWLDLNGVNRSTFGVDIRDCIRGAVLGEYKDES